MPQSLSPAHAVLGGSAILMACACGAAVNSAKLIGIGGLTVSSGVFLPAFIGVAAALIIHGLWCIARIAAVLAACAFAVLVAGAALTPQSAMVIKALPWDVSQMTGAGLYVVAAGILVYAFWGAFPSPRPAASGVAMSGAALAAGCTCCMVTGAVAGLAATAGANVSVVESTPLLFWAGLTLAAAGLLRLGGLRAALWVPAGGLIIKYGPQVLKLTGDWMVSGVNLRFLPSYLITIAGAGAIMYGFSLAYEVAHSRSRELTWTSLAREPALG
ncbi:MAG: hypothetical protein ABIZ96_05635 [Gemmatimonadales bacterium]